MKQVNLIRGRIMRALVEINSYISCLPERELEALQALDRSTVEGNTNFARIVDLVLAELGHQTTQGSYRTLAVGQKRVSRGWPKGKRRKTSALQLTQSGNPAEEKRARGVITRVNELLEPPHLIV